MPRYYLRRDVIWRATHRLLLATTGIYAGGQAEIGNFKIQIFREEDVGQLEVSVNYPVGVKVQQALDELNHDFSRFGLREWLVPVLKIAIELAASAQLHD